MLSLPVSYAHDNSRVQDMLSYQSPMKACPKESVGKSSTYEQDFEVIISLRHCMEFHVFGTGNLGLALQKLLR
jgi:hypothetical protein